jgi:hypothetical protein
MGAITGAAGRQEKPDSRHAAESTKSIVAMSTSSSFAPS